MEQTVTMMSEEEAPEVGPNDIVIHLVNPYKCGMCELEFLEKKVFKEHMFSHLEQLKQERPSSQIVMSLTLPPETPGGVTVTRDILQLGEDGSIKQVLQPNTNLSGLHQVSPLRELEEAGVLKLDPPKQTAPVIKTNPTPAQMKPGGQSLLPIVNSPAQQNNGAEGGVVKIEGEDGEETEVSEIVDNKDGSFSVKFKGPNNEMQHIQILKPDGMKGEMMIELTNNQGKRRNSRGGTPSKNNECDICGKVLSSFTNLLRHKMYHKAERPYKCDICSKGFKDVSNLKKHTQIHKRIFPCFLCKKSFLMKSLLLEHLKRHESRTTYVKTGNTTKEVTVRTFVDDDGTRVEEMNMAMLGNKTFEYKHRILKADPSEIVKVEKVVEDGSMEVPPTTDPESAELVAAAEGAEAPEDSTIHKSLLEEGAGGESELHKSLLALATAGVKEEDSMEGSMLVEGAPNSTDPIDVDAPKLQPAEDFVKVYQCGHCGKRTVQRGNMMRHIIHHLKDKPFACDECPKRFVDKGELVKHVKTHTKPVRCPQCHGAFAHNRQLLKHLEGECMGTSENLNYTVLEDGQTYKCNICQIEMKRLGNMIKHVGSHQDGDKKSTWHQRKNKKIDTKNLSAPYSYNAMKQVYVCKFCRKMFRTRVCAEKHAKAHSSGKVFRSQVFNKPYKCDLCSAAFTRKLFLDTHKRKHEDGDREEETVDYGTLEDKSGYYCKHCNKKLNQKYRMMSHIQCHLGERTFECQDCNKCFSSLFLLIKHKKSHSTRVTCDVCGISFTRQFFLDVHKKKSHQSTPMDAYMEDLRATDEKEFFSCSICGAPFSRRVIMNNHEKKCREESKVMVRLPMGKGFQCKICHKVATLKHNLMVHIRKHEDVVKIDSDGRLFIISEKWSEDSGEGSTMTPFGKFTRRPRTSTPRTPQLRTGMTSTKKSLKSQMKSDLEASDSEFMELDDFQQDEEEEEDQSTGKDDKFTKTTGGWACTICRKKFTDKSTVLRHLSVTHTVVESGSQEKDSSDDMKKDATDIGKEEGKSDEEAPMEVEGEEAIKSSAEASEQNGQVGSDKTEEESTKQEESMANTPKASGESTQAPKSKLAASAPAAGSKTSKNKAAIEATTPKTVAAPRSPRTGNRPSRTQKLPSRFLE